VPLCLHALFVELSLTQCSRRFAHRPGGTRPRCPAPYPPWPGWKLLLAVG